MEEAQNLGFLAQYGLFLLKIITFAGVLIWIMATAAKIAQMKKFKEKKGEIIVTPLNEFFKEIKDTMKQHVFSSEALQDEEKAEKQKSKEDKKVAKKEAQKNKKDSKDKESGQLKVDDGRKRIYVLDFDGDVKASEADFLMMEVTAILTVARPGVDEVVIRLESPGGMVSGYGLAASQLKRIRDAGIHLTACVDKVAASGGYMMACVADQIIAAPFAVVGSIGVVAQLPNFNKVLKKLDVDYDIYTAGQYKRTVTVLGENSEDGKKKFKEELEEVHELFKQMVHSNRPDLDLDKVATGEHWYGEQSVELKLVDKLQTSEDYLYAQSTDADLFEVEYEFKEPWAKKMGIGVQKVFSNLFTRQI